MGDMRSTATVAAVLVAVGASLISLSLPHAVTSAGSVITLSSEPGGYTAELYQGSFLDTTQAAMLHRLGVMVAPEDKVYAFPDPALGVGSLVKVYRAPRMTIVDAGTAQQVRSWQTTVQGLLDEQQIELGNKDVVVPALDQPVAQDAQIKITRVAEVQITKDEVIAFSVKNVQSADLEKGKTQTTVAGVNGVKAVTYTVRRVDGKEVSRKISGSVVTKPPVSQVVTVGIGPKLAKAGPYMDVINAAAKKYLINGTALRCLMMKESGGGPNTGYPDASYKGLFQYSDGYWASASAVAGYAGASIYSAEAQIYATAYALTHGQTGRWPTWPGCRDQ